jgi:phosphate transport system substrate-binding protein
MLFLTCCTKRDNSTNKLILTGSSTVAPLVAEFGKRFEKGKPDVRINVQTGGSSRGISDVKKDISNIGMVSRALKENEKEFFSFQIALDGVCVIINKENPVKSLSDQQIVDIYKKKIINWKDVGGCDI